MKRLGALLGLAAALTLVPIAAASQTVLARVVDGATSRPTFGALAYLVDPGGVTIKNALTDERGRALFVGIPAGRYRVRVEMIGMSTVETDLFDVMEGASVSQDVRLESSAIQLDGLEVELDAGRCRVRPGGEGLLVAEVWDEARKALSAAAFTDDLGTYRYETMTYDRTIDRDAQVILAEEQKRREGYMRAPFESRPAEDLIENGFVQADGRDRLWFAPDASVLLSDAFLDTHCFRLVDAGTGPDGFIGLGFEPTGEDRRVADIAGELWLHPETAELQWIEFRYEYLDPELTSPLVGGRVDFQRMPNGTWIVPEWWIRMPVLGTQTDVQRRQRAYIAQYRQTGGMVLEAREAGGRSLGQRVETGGIEGIVTDSLGVPMRGVRVGVVGSNQEVFTNAEGHYSVTGLTAGRYRIRFVASDLEAIGYIPEPVPRDIIRGELSYFDFHMPSIGDVLLEACEGEVVPERSVVVAGLVRDHRGRLASRASVSIQWFLYDPDRTGSTVTRTSEGFETTANDTGFFRFCGVPSGEVLQVRAVREGLVSDPVELRLSLLDGAGLVTLELPAPREPR